MTVLQVTLHHFQTLLRFTVVTNFVLLLFTVNAGSASEYAIDTVFPIESYDTARGEKTPIGYAETKAFHSDFHQGFLGCLQEHDLCNQEEVCFDDALFGQCVSKDASTDETQPLGSDWLTPDAIKTLNEKLKELANQNFNWHDAYTQCVLQSTLGSIKMGFAFDDSSLCRLTLNDLDESDRLEDDLEASLNDLDQELNQVEIERKVYPNIIDSESFDKADTKRQDPSFHKSEVDEYAREKSYWKDGWKGPDETSDAATSNIKPPNFSVKQQEDGGILIEPGQIPSAGPVESVPDPSYGLFLDDLPSAWGYNPQESSEFDKGVLNVGEKDDSPYISQHPIVWFEPHVMDDQPERTAKSGQYFYFDDPPFVGSPSDEQLSRVRRHFSDRDTEQLPDNLILAESSGTDDTRDTSNREGAEEMVFPLTYGPYQGGDQEILSRHKFDMRPVEEDFDYPTSQEQYEMVDQQPFDEQLPDSDRLIFNRRERLDVKKPGPYWPFSDRSYYLNKIVNDNEEQHQVKLDSDKQENIMDSFSPFVASGNSEDETSSEVGQVEYEMPLLAPVKDKRVLDVHQMSRHLDAASKPMNMDFVHMFLKNRFDTMSQGHDLIDALADDMGVPPQALTDRLIEDHHVQFKVNQNPQNINAENIASNIEHNVNLRKRIGSEIGVNVEEAAPGTKDEYVRMSSRENFVMTHLNLVVGAASFFAAILAAVATIFIIKRRCRRSFNNNDKLTNCENDPLDSERGKVQEEYKQLCRDWSRCSKTIPSSEDKGKNSGSPTNKKLQSQDSKNSDKSSTSSWGEEPTSTNMDISTGHMVLAYMEDHLKNKQRLEQEWVGLCSYEAEPCATAVAFKAENKKKNRYPDKLPYDHNRVILNAVLNASNSDYINASTVSDHDPRNPSYIVTQGPLAQTVADFWQMIWEQGCVVIVMLTRLQDNGYQLCHRYWPEEGSEQYHIFEVHLVSEHVWCEDYLVRSVYLKNTRTGETRTVTQFHFRSWPAQSVPASTKALLEFRRKVNKSYRGRSCPICIHCSDGVGRTGTYVLIDMVLNRMAKGCKEIDIAATLEHIRDQRSGMVQTRPQFEFSLMAVAEEVHAILKALLP